MAEELNTDTPEQQETPAVQSVMSAQPKTLSVADVKSKIDTQTPLYSNEYLPSAPKNMSAKGFYGQFRGYGGASVYSQPPFASSLSTVQGTSFLPQQPQPVQEIAQEAPVVTTPPPAVETQTGDSDTDSFSDQVDALLAESDTTPTFSFETLSNNYDAFAVDLLNNTGIDVTSVDKTLNNIGTRLSQGLQGTYNDAIETVNSVKKDIESLFEEPGIVTNTVTHIKNELSELSTQLSNLVDPEKIEDSLKYFGNKFLETSLAQVLNVGFKGAGLPVFLANPLGIIGALTLMGDQEGEEDSRVGMNVVGNFDYDSKDSLIGKNPSQLVNDGDVSKLEGFKTITVDGDTFTVGYTKGKDGRFKAALTLQDKQYIVTSIFDNFSLIGKKGEDVDQAIRDKLKEDNNLSDYQMKNLSSLPEKSQYSLLGERLGTGSIVTGDSDVAPPPSEKFRGYPVPEVTVEQLPDLTGDKEKEAKDKEDKVGAPFNLLSRENMNRNAPSLFPSGPEARVSKVTMEVLDPQKLTMSDIQDLKNNPNLSDRSKTEIDIQEQKLKAEIRTEQLKKEQKEQQRKELEEVEEVERIQAIVAENISLLSQDEIDIANRSFLDQVDKIEKSKNPDQKLRDILESIDEAIVKTYQNKEAKLEQRQKYSSQFMLMRQKLQQKYSNQLNKFGVKRKRVVYVPKDTLTPEEEEAASFTDFMSSVGTDPNRSEESKTTTFDYNREDATYTPPDSSQQEQTGDDAGGQDTSAGAGMGGYGDGYW
jgi:hypothetical protein